MALKTMEERAHPHPAGAKLSRTANKKGDIGENGLKMSFSQGNHTLHYKTAAERLETLSYVSLF